MNALRDLRRAADLGQREFAALLSVPLETLRTWDSGRRPVPVPMLRRAAAAVARHQRPREVLPLATLARELHELHQYYPTRTNPRGRPTAYILNVYTEPGHRRQGLAHQLIAEILAWCRAQDIPRASLHASPFGRSVYQRLGFAQTNEMRADMGAEDATRSLGT